MNSINTEPFYLRLIKDFRFWLFFFFLIRLIGITQAPLEIAHNWRQSLTNMTARNFVELGPDLLHPRIDMAGEKTGIIGSEFPFFNYLIYLVSDVFGYTHWYGRLINLIVSSLGIFFFYKTIKKLFNPKTAFYSAIVLTVSIWFSFSRKTMPDTFSVSLVIMGLYFVYQYLTVGKWYNLVLFFTLCTLGMLCKIPALSLFCLIALVPFLKKADIKSKIVVIITASISFIIVCLWYFYWVPHLLIEYQFQLYFPRSIIEGFKEVSGLLPELFEQFYFNSLHTFIGFFAFVVGLYFLLRSGKRLVKIGFILVSLVFGAFILKTGFVFPTHSYYIIPYTPVMAAIVGFTFDKLPKKWAVILVVLIVVEAIGNQQHDFFIKDKEMYKLSLEHKINKVIPQNELIVINGGASPQHIYFANRKGWSAETEEISSQFLDSVLQLGAKYLVVDITKENIDYPEYELSYSDEFYKIYSLEH